MSVDISDIAKENHRYAIHLATCQNIITYKNSTFEISDVLSKKEPLRLSIFGGTYLLVQRFF